MKKIFLFSAFFLFFFIFIGKNYSYAATAITCTAPSFCKTPACGSELKATGEVCLTEGGVGGNCCVPKDAVTDTGTGTGTGTWGSPGSGPSLGDVSKLLGRGAPAYASKASFNSIVGLVLSLLILAAIILSLLFLIWGGIDWITSGGDKQKLQSAKHKIAFAIVGLVIVFLAFFIINVIDNLFGINLVIPASGGGGGKPNLVL